MTIEYHLEMEFDGGSVIAPRPSLYPREIHDNVIMRFAQLDQLMEVRVERRERELVGIFRRAPNGDITYEARP